MASTDHNGIAPRAAGPPPSDPVLDAHLQHLIDRGRAPLAYQPIVRLADQAVVGAEALLRVTDAEGAPVAPGAVLAAAERLGAVGDLSRTVLMSACEEAARWRRARPERVFVVSVNVSAGELADPGLVDRVAEALAATRLEPSRLVLEISESDLMADPDAAARQLARLKMLGARLVVDDFGTGRSSLPHLKRFPLDAIKLDRSFIAGLPGGVEDLAVVRAMLGVAAALGLHAIAEGLEGEDQLVKLRDLACGFGQGFLWSRAVGGDTLLSLLGNDVTPTAELLAAPEPPADGSGQSVPDAGSSSDAAAALGVLVHELRTPLTVVLGYASMIEQSADEVEADAASRIRRAGERIEQVMRNLEDVHAVDAGTLRPHRRPADLPGLVRRVIDDLGPTLDVAVSLAVEGGAEELEAELDVARVEQIVINLISNAAKHTPPGAEVTVEVTATDDWAEVSVLDDGPGIRADDLGLVFRKFGRADRSVPGSGLGLYLSRGVARAHGGDISYRFRHVDHGSVFTLRLPRRAPKVAVSGPTTRQR